MEVVVKSQKQREEERKASERKVGSKIWHMLVPFLLVISVLGGITLASHLLWRAKEVKVLDVTIVDKTVPWDNYREHMGLIWALNYERYIRPDGTNYNPVDHYIGYYPFDRDNPDLLMPADVEGKDMLYVTDTYGVYTLDLQTEDKSGALDYSKLIFGGIEEIEMQAIEAFVDEGDRTLITEFNYFADPTPTPIRKRLEDIIKAEWSEWSGRFFEDLGDYDAIPKWLPRLYRAQYGKEYEFEGPGIIYVSEGGQVVILERGKHFQDYPFVINIPERSTIISEDNLKIPYFYWFDIVEPDNPEEEIASYEFHFTEEGKQEIAGFGIPETFPAIVEHRGDYVSYYFAGDFVDTPVRGDISGMFEGLPQILSLLSNMDTSHSQHQFFWKFYRPLILTILDETYQRLHPNNQ